MGFHSTLICVNYSVDISVLDVPGTQRLHLRILDGLYLLRWQTEVFFDWAMVWQWSIHETRLTVSMYIKQDIWTVSPNDYCQSHLYHFTTVCYHNS